MSRSFTLLLLAGLAASAASAQSPATTPQELRTAISQARPGDTVTMADGRWTDLGVEFDAEGAEGDSTRLVP